jgi:cytochrome c553
VKKFILMLLLLAVTFQSAWAANGAYCRHEDGAASFHFGHHSHRHQGHVDASDKKASFGKIHFDCTSCHAASPALATATKILGVFFLPRFYPQPVATIYTSHIPDGPQWPDRLPVV